MSSKSILRCLKNQRWFKLHQGVFQSKQLCTHVQAKPSSESESEIGTPPPIDPLQYPDYFNVHNLFTIKDLFDARVHYGHKDGLLDPKMLPYIYGSRLGHVIFDLDITADHLRQALNFTAHIAYRDGIIVFLNRNPLTSYYVENVAKECGEFAITRFWSGGVFTNSTVKFKTVTRLPDLCIFFNTLNPILTQHKGVRDCAKMLIPTVAIVDSNCNPNLITYPIPGNDDSPATIQLFGSLFKEAIMRGKEARKKYFEAQAKVNASS